VRDDAEAGGAGALFEEVGGFAEKFGIAVEVVDDEAFQARRIGRIEDGEGAGDGRDDAAAMDVADEQDGEIGGGGKAHVGDVAVAQIDLGGGAGALDQHEIAGGRQVAEAFEDGGEVLGAPVHEVARLEGGDAVTAQDHL
jgi:hypothetical protein